MRHEYPVVDENIKSSNEYHQCTILWKKLPPVFKVRWRNEAKKLAISGYNSGYKLFIKTNVNNLIVGDEIKISPWH